MDDITAFVGIIGAIVGGGIGLLGQRMNIREQRRKELRERVLDYVVDAVRLRDFAFSIRPMPKFDSEEGAKVWKDLEDRVWVLRKSNQHLILVSPPRLRKRVEKLSETLFSICHLVTFNPMSTDQKGRFLDATLTFGREVDEVLDYLKHSYYRQKRKDSEVPPVEDL